MVSRAIFNGWPLVPPSKQVATPALPPSNVSAPSITGSASVGSILTGSNGNWANSPTGYAYQWSRNGSAISGAVSGSYTLVSADLGAMITVTVTASNAAGSAAATSAGVGPVTSSIPSVTLPTLTGLVYDFSADNPSNVSTVYSENFVPSAINTSTGVITLASPAFKNWQGFSSANGVALEFSTTGTLPPEYADNTKQYFMGADGKIYAQPTASDYATIPGQFQWDSLLPAQNFAQQANAIIPSSQGTGTHTIKIKADKLIQSLVNQVSGKNYTTDALDSADLNTYFEQFTDSQGKKYLRSQRLARNNIAGYGSAYITGGKTFRQGPSSAKLAARQEVAGQRTIAHTWVTYWDPSVDQLIARSNIPNANVTVASPGVFTQPVGPGQSAMSLIGNASAAEPTRCRLVSGTTLPTVTGINLATDTFYVRTSSLTFKLYLTAADAMADTNACAVTAAGSGTFQFYQLSVPGDSERMRFLVEHLNPANSSNNVMSARFNAFSPGDVTQIISTDFIVSGSSNGEIGFSGRNAQGAGELAAVTVQFPPGAVVPVRSDTGLPMTSGVYYTSFKPGSGAFVRLHDTLSQATAAVGVATSSLTGANACVKFNAGTYSGRCSIKAVDRTFNVDAFTGSGVITPWKVPVRTKIVLTCVTDFNDPAATYVKERVFCNGVKVAEYELTGHTKGLTPAAVNDGQPAWTLMNSAASHVPWEGRFYRDLFQASTGAISDSEFVSLHNALQPFYGA